MRLLLLAFLPLFIPIAYAKNASPTSTTEAPAAVPTIELLPQKGYIVPLPPEDQNVNVQTTDNTGTLTGAIGIIVGIATGLYAKFAGARDVKNTNAAVLQTKDIQKEIARVMYNFKPDQSKALSDAPSIKLENLEKDRAEFATKVAKS